MTGERQGVVGLVPGGLSSGEAAERLGRDGPNVLPPPPPRPVWRRVAAQLRDPLILVLLVAVALTLVTGDWTDAAVIGLVIVVNTAVGVAQEVKADRAIAALAAATAPEARVVRDARQVLVPAADVVVGDLLVLGEGDIVAADADLVEAAALLVDESALSGESVPVDKSVPGGAARLSAGTVVVRGRGRAVVTATGAASALGRIAALMAPAAALTPLQRRLVGLGRVLAGAAVVLCVLVGAIGLVRGQPVELMVVTAISLVVAAVPESLPAVVTLALALGARRMAARHALVRRLPAVETLGSVTVLATDKTGTLTEGSMVARRLWTPTGTAEVGGGGYRPEGAVRRDGGAVTAATAPDLVALLAAAALCNDARLRPPDDPAGDSTRDGTGEDGAGEWVALGDPTEAALLAAAGKLGVDRAALAARWPRVAELPFDSGRRRMTTVHARPGGGVRVVCKGAPEAVLRPAVLADPPDLVERAAVEADRLARSGHRVLAIAQADRDRAPVTGPTDPGARTPLAPATGVEHDLEQGLEHDLEQGLGVEQGLRLLGLVGLVDPPRPAAPATIAACRAAGITPVLITGDHPATAAAIATELGIVDTPDEVVDCRHLPPAARPGGPAGVGGNAGVAGWRGRVFARAAPEQKLDIVQARRDAGDIVAMTGDGVNDGPALRRADIGVAMGRRGTEVARQAADLVLADDELGTVVAAAEEGRRVYDNIRRFLLYGLSGGATEIAVMLAGPFLGLPLPLLPAQILWINLLTHGLPGVALGSEPVEPGAMRRPPRPPAESVLGAGLWQRIVRVGIVITAVTLGVALWGHATGRPWQSMAFLALGATQLTVALGSRARPGTRANPMLLVAVAGALVLQLAGVYLPPLADLLGTQPVGPLELAVIAVLSCLGYAAIRLDRLVHRARPGWPAPS